MNPDCNPIEQQARQDRLEAAYAASGRDQLPAGDPRKSTYTGLLTQSDDDNNACWLSGGATATRTPHQSTTRPLR